jgi:hypothetical protein
MGRHVRPRVLISTVAHLPRCAPHQLDVASDKSCARLSQLGTVDEFVNNVAVIAESDENPLAAGVLSQSAFEVAPDLRARRPRQPRSAPPVSCKCSRPGCAIAAMGASFTERQAS